MTEIAFHLWARLSSPSLLRLLAPVLAIGIWLAARRLWGSAGGTALGRAIRWWCLAVPVVFVLAGCIYALVALPDDPAAAAAILHAEPQRPGRTAYPQPVAATGALTAAAAGLYAAWQWRSVRLRVEERAQLAAEWGHVRHVALRRGAAAFALLAVAGVTACAAAASGAPQIPAVSRPAGTSSVAGGTGSSVLWVGGDAGVSRLVQTPAGARWEALAWPYAPLPSNRIKRMAVGPAGDVWLGTDAGLVRYAGNGERPHWQTLNVSNSPLPHRRVLGLAVDRDGVAWAATERGGAAVDPSGGGRGFTSQNAPLVHQILDAVYVDPLGRIWFGGAGGVNVYVPPRSPNERGEWPAGFGQYTTGGALPDDLVFRIYGDSRGRVWFGTDGGVAVLKVDPDRYGLGAFDASRWQTFTTRNSPLVHDKVHAIVEDRHGRIWLGTEGGVNVLDLPDAPTSGLATATARAPQAAQASGQAGQAPPAGQAARWERFTTSATPASPGATVAGPSTTAGVAGRLGQGLPHPWVEALAIGPDGRIWAGTRGGLAVIDPDQLEEGWTSYHGHPLRRWLGYLWPPFWRQNPLSDDITALAWSSS